MKSSSRWPCIVCLWVLLGTGLFLSYRGSMQVMGQYSKVLSFEEEALLNMVMKQPWTTMGSSGGGNHSTGNHGTIPKIHSNNDFESNPQNTSSSANNDPRSKLGNGSPPSSSASLIDPSLSFSACLLVMDENHRLPEWLAYHYYALPLTHLVILVDPRSHTSPASVLKPWKDWNLMRIDEWTDKDIHFRPYSVSKNSMIDTVELLSRNHRQRQGRFYKHCAAHIQKVQQQSAASTNTSPQSGWTGFFDVDEYLVLDHLPDKMARMQKPGFVAQFLKDAELCGRDPANHCYSTAGASSVNMASPKDATPHRIPWPDQLVEFSNAAVHARQCVMPTRTYYGSKFVPPSHVNQTALVPEYLQNISLFEWETLSHLYRTSHIDPRGFGKGKTLWKIPTSGRLRFYPKGQGIHKIADGCEDGNFAFSPLRIRHYLGSWKSYTSRLDARTGTKRNRQLFEYRSDVGHILDPDILHWLQNFANLLQHNVSRIQRLVRGAGQVHNTTDPALWEIDPRILRHHLESSPAAPCRMASECFAGIKFFREWLRKKYRLEKLANGTQVVVETTPRKSME